MNDLRHLEIMFEDMQNTQQIILEVISVIQADIAYMKPLVELIPGMIEEQAMFRRSFSIHSRQLRDHGARIGRLETIS
jgi:hypothetical protein